MPRRLVLALGVTALAAATLASTSAHARYYRFHYACVVTKKIAWLTPRGCYHHSCRQRIIRGRAFRVLGQHRHKLWVWNMETEGLIDVGALHLKPESYCYAAGV